MTISVIGQGKLGLCFSCILASKYKVIAIDNNSNHIAKLNKSILPIQETNLNKWYSKYRQNITFTTHFDCLGNFVFVVVPTPSLKNSYFTSDFVENVFSLITKPKVIAIVSTLMPSETMRLQKKYPHLTLIYNPTFIALGSVIENFTNPNFILIGADKQKGIEKLKDIYNHICPKFIQFNVLTSLEAEIAKLVLNCYLTTKITFANQIGNLCYRLDISADKILETIGQDPRIGNQYFKAGLGYGGPCFPRDNLALSAYFKSLKLNPALFNQVHNLNNKQINEIVNRVILLNPKSIGFKSISYKEDTKNTEYSQLKEIKNKLIKCGYKTLIGKGNVNLDWGGII